MHAIGIPYEIRTRVNNVKGWCPWPLDERDICGRTGRTRTGTHKAGDFKSPVATNYTTVPYLVEITGIEPVVT